MNYIIEPMGSADKDEVFRIYAEGMAGNNATFETKLPEWESWYGAKRPDCRYVARSLDANGRLFGWVVVSPTSKRPVYAGVCEHSIYISNDAQGIGVGSSLMTKLIERSEELGIWTLYSSLFPENEASIRLHKKFGFYEVGRRKRIAFHPGVEKWRDTIIMERRSSVAGV